MKFLRAVFRVFRLGLLGVLLLYWAVFAGNSIAKLVTGGPAQVTEWYRHLAFQGSLSGTCTSGGCALYFPPLNVLHFWMVQFIYFVFTLLLIFLEWSHRRTAVDRKERERG